MKQTFKYIERFIGSPDFNEIKGFMNLGTLKYSEIRKKRVLQVPLFQLHRYINISLKVKVKLLFINGGQTRI